MAFLMLGKAQAGDRQAIAPTLASETEPWNFVSKVYASARKMPRLFQRLQRSRLLVDFSRHR
jgi:hypothetical protein